MRGCADAPIAGRNPDESPPDWIGRIIGMHCIERLLARGDTVVGVDNLNDYYEVSLKEARLARIAGHENFSFHRVSVEDRDAMAALFAAERPDRVIHLAAQAGVRYSLESACLYGCEPSGVHEHSGRVSP